MTKSESAATEHTFEAEVSRLLHLMVHAVYSDREIFLRELISNAADACEKLRYLSVQDPALIGGDGAFRITIAADPEEGRLTVSDNGIGMSAEEMKDNLGTIAKSGTRAFLDSLEKQKDGQQLIGQFGVGFYSAFMVADRVRVVSRKAGSDEAFAWESDGKGTFTIEPVPLMTRPSGARVWNSPSWRTPPPSPRRRRWSASSRPTPRTCPFRSAGSPQRATPGSLPTARRSG